MMSEKFFILVFSFLFSTVLCEQNATSFPKLYEMDDVEECAQKNGIFCKIKIILLPYNSSLGSAVWTKIQEANNDYRYFQRNKLNHGRCFKQEQARSVKDILEDDYSKRYLNISLIGKVQRTSCFEKDRLILNDLDQWDITFISFGLLYGIFVISLTMYMMIFKNDSRISKKIQLFSLISSWKELQKSMKHEKFKNLKSIQGIRTLTMLFIISSHAFYGNMFLFLKNPEYVENIYINFISRVLVTVYPFLVQTFFLISAWLLSVQLIKIVGDHKELTLRQVVIILLNRYVRLMTLILISIAVHRSNLAHDLISYINEDILRSEVNKCRYYWWKNLMFVQNFFDSTNICSSVTWYVAADFQLYSITVVIFYASNKFNIKRKHFIVLLVLISAIIQCAIISTKDFQGLMRLFPKTANLGDELVSNAFTLSYIPIWCNTFTYMLGVIFGTIFSERKQEPIFNSKLKTILCLLGLFGLPLSAIIGASFQYEMKFFEILVSVLARPVFGAGIGIGILGMATGAGGLVKHFFESKPLIFLANFCYSVYLFHDVVVFLRIFRINKLVQLSILYIVKYTLADYFLSFALGAIIHISIELPLIRLQKLTLPQITKGEIKMEDDIKSKNNPI